ncbi:DUF1501 domain-containing protein, partial [bacterium]
MSRDSGPRIVASRRSFLKLAGAAALASPFAAREREAFAQTAGQATYVIEINLRDQLDFMHVMVPPGLAKDVNLKRGETGKQAALYFNTNELIAGPNNIFLTPQSKVLQPHADTMAMIELCDLTSAPVHGHEASNPVRSPGRTKEQSAGRMPMWQGEPGQDTGEGASYSSTPTIVSLHNYVQKRLNPGLANGVAIKGQSRPGGIYHFGAGLPGAELDRYQSYDSMLKAFPASVRDVNVLQTAGEAEAMQRYLKRVDAAFLTRRRQSAAAKTDHAAQVDGARGLLNQGAPKVFNLALTEEEKAYWSADVPKKYGRMTMESWEQMAYAFKFVAGDVVRSVALEIDIGDQHDSRPQSYLAKLTDLVVLPLARLLESLKRVGIYDRTLVVV